MKSRLAVALALLIHAALALHNLTLPGLHPDEAQEAALQAQQILAGLPVTAFRGAAVHVAGLEWPLMVQDYIGSIHVLLALPFFALLGPSVFSLRLMSVSVSLVTIAVAYAFTTATFGRRPAALASLLLAAQPSFLFWGRQGVYVTSATATLALAWLWSLTSWRQRRGAWSAALAGFLAGLGVYAKLLFLWIVGGAITAAVTSVLLAMWLERPRASSPKRRQVGVYTWPIKDHVLRFTHYVVRAAPFLAAFLLGLSPLVLYNLKTSGTLASIGGNLTTSFYGVNNLALAGNLATRWDMLRAVLAGRDHLWYLGGSFGNPYTEWALAAAVAAIAARTLAQKRGWLAPVGLVALVSAAFLQSIFTVSGLFPTHFAILMPLFPIAIAVGLESVLVFTTEPPRHADTQNREHDGDRTLNFPKDRGSLRGMVAWVLRVLLFVGTASLIGRDLWVDVRYHRTLRQTGGLNVHSDAVYPLAAFLDSTAGRCPVVALDWGYAPSVRFLTSGRVAPTEIFGFSNEPDEAFRERLAAALEYPDTLYVLHWPQESIFPRDEAFREELEARGLTLATVRTFSRRDGAPVFDVVALEGSACAEGAS